MGKKEIIQELREQLKILRRLNNGEQITEYHAGAAGEIRLTASQTAATIQDLWHQLHPNKKVATAVTCHTYGGCARG